MKNEKSSFTIKNWDVADRPREKLVSKGKRALSDAELIAILIGSGNRNESAVELGKRILAKCENNLGVLAQMSTLELEKFKGIGEAKAISILTGLELGRRLRLSETLKLDKITSSKDVFELMQPLLGSLEHEEFWVLFLNNSNKVLHKLLLSKGGLTGTVVDVRLLFKQTIEHLATGIILCHNHPSGSLVPSTADKEITRKIQNGAVSLDIKVLDHLIITEKAYFSFADEGQL
jgi:DNA repair protein RadC